MQILWGMVTFMVSPSSSEALVAFLCSVLFVVTEFCTQSGWTSQSKAVTVSWWGHSQLLVRIFLHLIMLFHSTGLIFTLQNFSRSTDHEKPSCVMNHFCLYCFCSGMTTTVLWKVKLIIWFSVFNYGYPLMFHCIFMQLKYGIVYSQIRDRPQHWQCLNQGWKPSFFFLLTVETEISSLFAFSLTL